MQKARKNTQYLSKPRTTKINHLTRDACIELSNLRGSEGEKENPMLNICLQCEATLRVYIDGNDFQATVIDGETVCCCGSIDSDGNYYDALCSTCCGPHGSEIWEGKSAGGGYYIVNPSY